MATPSLFRRFTNAIGLTTPEPTPPSPAEAAQQKCDNIARERFAEAGRTLGNQEMHSETSPETKSYKKLSPDAGIVETFKRKWQDIIQNEADGGAYGKLTQLRADIAFMRGNKKVEDLTDEDFKAFGIKSDEYASVLSRVAMNSAVNKLKGLKATIVAGGNALDIVESMNGLLADTEYAKKGGMKHAREVMLSLSGTGIRAEGLQELQKEAGRQAAELYGKALQNRKHDDYEVNLLFTKRLLRAIEMAGEDIADNQVILKYSGRSKEDFLKELNHDLGELEAHGNKPAIDEFRQLNRRMSRQR